MKSSGFKGPRKQGGWVGLAVAGMGLASSLFGGGGGGGAMSSQQAMGYADPYAAYRPAAASALNNLMKNPSSIQNLPTYQAAMQGAQRQSAAQGYTGSGNALAAAADASGQVYQQQFNNLAMLSGANVNPAQAAGVGVNAGQNGFGNLQTNLAGFGSIAGDPNSGFGSWMSNLLGGGSGGQTGYTTDGQGGMSFLGGTNLTGLATNMPSFGG